MPERRLTPQQRRRLTIWWTITWAGPVALLLTLLLIRVLGDRFFLALPLLFGPRWVVAPLVLTPLLAALVVRRVSLRATLAGVLLLALVLDFRLPWGRLLPGPGQGTVVTVMTFNAQGGGPDYALTAADLFSFRADLIAVQECRPALSEELERQSAEAGYQLHTAASQCMLSRHPVVSWEPRNPMDLWKMSGSGGIARMVISIDSQDVVFGGIHLETPRDALSALAKGALFSFPGADADSREMRELESTLARTWIAPPDEVRPLIIAGDFNMVHESAIYGRWWDDLLNAFNRQGFGLGWSKRTRLFGVRIDHVLSGNGVMPIAARLGPELGSDHRPIVAELVIPPGF